MIFREGRLTSSYTQISKYQHCPMSWKLRYKDRIKIDSKNKHLEYGLAVHETLEYLFLEKKNGFNIPLKLIEDILKYNLEKRDIPFENPVEEKDWELRAQIMLENLFEEGSELERLMMNSTIIGVELPFELPIEIQERTFINTETGEEEVFDTVWIIGFIDLVLKTDEGIVVIDHKSGKKKFQKAKLRKGLQFPIYAMAIKHLFGEYPVKSYYNFTKIHTSQELLFTETINLEMIEKMNKRMAKTIWAKSPEIALMDIRKVFDGMYISSEKVTPSPLCYWCDFGFHNTNICRASSKWKPRKGA